MTRPDEILEALVAATHEPASALHFTPVALRVRADGWTPERQRRFVAGIAATGRADRAAALCAMTEQSAGRLRRRPDGASFAAACAAAYTLAKQVRRARKVPKVRRERPARAEGSEGSPVAAVFRPGGPNLPHALNLPPPR
jgi:hypothetical protein